jgi:hypothetical protein
MSLIPLSSPYICLYLMDSNDENTTNLIPYSR